MSDTPLVQVKNLKKYYPVKDDVLTRAKGWKRAVDGVSFSVWRGETLGLVGESGCGKSTLGRQLIGLEKPTEGSVFFKGNDISHRKGSELRKIRTGFQMIFQDPYSSLNPRKHIFEILAQPMLYHKISSKATIERDIIEILDMVGLPQNILGRYPHEFSGGQRQRIGIAKALSLHPEFIVCDEPVSSLDVSIQAQILNLMKELQEKLHLTLLFIGHGLGAVHYVSDRIAVMYLGKIVEIGETADIFAHPVHPYTRALLDAVPVPFPEEGDEGRGVLQGEAGRTAGSAEGCRFYERCPYAVENCGRETPALGKVTEGLGRDHYAACPHIMDK